MVTQEIHNSSKQNHSKVKIIDLNWDSETYGIKMGKVDANTIKNWDPSALREVFEKKLEYYDHLFLVLDSRNIQEMYSIQQAGFYHIDTLLSVFKNQFSIAEINKNHLHFRNAIKDDESKIKKLTNNAFCHSRLFKDPYLKNFSADPNEIFFKWALDAIDNQNKNIIVLENQSIIVGYMVYSIEEKSISLELIASLQNSKKGYGSILLKHLEQAALSNNLSSIEAGVNINNINAIQFYQRNQYKINKAFHYYHLHK